MVHSPPTLAGRELIARPRPSSWRGRGGNLTLNDGSALNYQFGQANVPGGPLNDLSPILVLHHCFLVVGEANIYPGIE